MPKILVIADDLTGAADCAAALAGHGLRTVVLLGGSAAEPAAGLDADVVSVDADTRRLPPIEAAAETARLLRAHLHDDNTILYKKLDSTMRGNIGEELCVAIETRRSFAAPGMQVVAIFAPAFPATGRTTTDGKQLLNGEPLPEHRPGHDHRIHGSSDIEAILRASNLRPALLGLHQIRGDAEQLRRIIQTAAQQADVLVCDAQAEDDLRRIAEAATVLGPGAVWAGSAGLARHLPTAHAMPRTPQTSPLQSFAAGPTLFVIGSGSGVSRKQAEALAAESDTTIIGIPASVLANQESTSLTSTFKLELERALISGNDVAVLLNSGLQVGMAEQPLLAARLATFVGPFANNVGALVATGGETARAVCQAWGITTLRLIGEVESGLPFSVTSGWSRELPVITKAGGFGNRESLLRCSQFLRNLQRGQAKTQN